MVDLSWLQVRMHWNTLKRASGENIHIILYQVNIFFKSLGQRKPFSDKEKPLIWFITRGGAVSCFQYTEGSSFAMRLTANSYHRKALRQRTLRSSGLFHEAPAWRILRFPYRWHTPSVCLLWYSYRVTPTHLWREHCFAV